jgi:RsmE family RNA methyltransferase
VLRAEVGESFTVGALGGQMGQGTLVAIDEAEAVLEVVLDRDPPPPCPVDLLLAMPRPKILRKVLQAVASMGVKKLVLVGSQRVEKAYWGSPVLQPDAIAEELGLGLEQGRDTRPPVVEQRRFFKPLVEDELDTLFPSGARVMPHPTAPPWARAVPSPERTVLAIGPEGGWTPYEVDLLSAHGFVPASIGPNILRVDVAVPFLVGWVRGAR